MGESPRHTRRRPRSKQNTSTPQLPSELVDAGVIPVRNRHAAPTCYPVHKIPKLLQRVLDTFPEEERSAIDVYELQNLSIETVLDVKRFGPKASSDILCQAMRDRILEDRKQLTPDNKALVRKSKSVTYWHDQKYVASVIEKYNEQMNSSEMEEKRKYLNTKFAWTEADIARF